jgi:hypothetical protein
MVSSDTARIGIIRRAKFPQAPPLIRYRDVRPAVCAYLADDTRSVNPLTSAEQMFQQRIGDTAESSLRQDDARASILVLHALTGMRNLLVPYTFRQAPQSQPKLNLSGVDVSVRPDLRVTAPIRNVDHAGAALLRLTQSDSASDSAITKRREMGLYVATMVRMHVDQHMLSNLPVANRLCMSIDVQHGELFQAPDSNTRRTNDLTSACRMISALWPTIT